MFGILDVRRKSIVTLALSQDNRKTVVRHFVNRAPGDATAAGPVICCRRVWRPVKLHGSTTNANIIGSAAQTTQLARLDQDHYLARYRPWRRYKLAAAARRTALQTRKLDRGLLDTSHADTPV